MVVSTIKNNTYLPVPLLKIGNVNVDIPFFLQLFYFGYLNLKIALLNFVSVQNLILLSVTVDHIIPYRKFVVFYFYFWTFCCSVVITVTELWQKSVIVDRETAIVAIQFGQILRDPRESDNRVHLECPARKTKGVTRCNAG